MPTKRIDSKCSINRLYKEFRGKCYYCGIQTEISTPEKRNPAFGATRDHLISPQYGGVNTKNNIVLACNKCNSDKGLLDVNEWRLLRIVRPDKEKLIEVWKEVL